MDNLVFEESVNAEIDQSEFISKKWVYVNDTNSQNYTSQVVIDSTPLSNAGGYINWSEGFIIMPLVVQLVNNTTPANLPANTTLGDHCWAFKSGFWNIINSMTVEFNNQNIIQQTPFLNVFRSFKALTSFSQDDLLNHGSELGFYPDNAGSWTFNNGVGATSNATGLGLANNNQAFTTSSYCPVAPNLITTTTATPFIQPTQFAGNTGNPLTGAPSNPNRGIGSPYACNEGFGIRTNWFGYDPTNNSGTGQNLINNANTCSNVFRSSKVVYGTDGTVGWSICAKLRLKDLADYFAKCPLLKGSTMRFYINTNQASTTFTVVRPTASTTTGVITQGTLTAGTVNVIGGLTNPLMVASVNVGNGSSTLPNDTYTLSVSIFKSPTGAITSTNFQSCRLYAPVYKMNPLAEQRYLSLAPTKKILYNDIFQYQFNGINGDDSFNFLVSNGIQDIKSVLVVPFIAGGTATNQNGTAFNTLLSPFAPSGGMPDPITLTNFNIIVSGVNLFLNNELYDFEQFCEELASSNQLNGNLTTGLTSGLISQDMFSRAYRYYYGNCARILPSESGVSRSIQIQGKNASLVQCNLMVFVEFQRSMVIDISTGARIE
jgi:hypothetical protein